jgi:hypothetical protein
MDDHMEGSSSILGEISIGIRHHYRPFEEQMADHYLYDQLFYHKIYNV